VRNFSNFPNFLEDCQSIDQQLEPNSEEYDNVRVLNNVEFEQLDSNVHAMTKMNTLMM
jgi:hypothetical protein